jgi:hypothetical protein
MTLESDALADAALRFSEAIQSERASTLEALSNERLAAMQIIQALRGETQRRSQQAKGRFAFGLLLGSALGAGAIYMINQRTSEEVRLGLVSGAEQGGASFRERLRAAVEAGRRAATTQEQTLWDEYRKHLEERAKPPPPPPDDFL